MPYIPTPLDVWTRKYCKATNKKDKKYWLKIINKYKNERLNRILSTNSTT